MKAVSVREEQCGGQSAAVCGAAHPAAQGAAHSAVHSAQRSRWTAEFREGMRDGVPIAAGYFAVSFSLGIAAHNIGMSPLQGFFLSLLNNASAGEYAGISAIATGTSFAALAVLILITNARYLLMSCSLSQKLSPEVGLGQRLLIAWGITDELFGIGVARPGYTAPSYLYGAYLTALSCWAGGTACGVIAGNAFPALVVAALSASIFGMFLAIILPQARKDKVVLAVVLSGFALSSLFSFLPLFAHLTESVRVIILTLLISVCAAIFRPVADEESEGDDTEKSVAAGENRPTEQTREEKQRTTAVAAEARKEKSREKAAAGRQPAGRSTKRRPARPRRVTVPAGAAAAEVRTSPAGTADSRAAKSAEDRDRRAAKPAGDRDTQAADTMDAAGEERVA